MSPRLICGCLNIVGKPTVAGFCTTHGAAIPMLQALKAVLLFHSDGYWDAAKQARWKELTGQDEATSRNLCDVVRGVVSLAETGQ